MREIIEDKGKKWFKKNRIIRTLLSTSKLDLNNLSVMYDDGLFTLEEMKEFYQLIGYGVNGYEELFDVKVEV